MLERLALARLFPHISISPSFCPLQSAYRKFHSTETALLKLTNDIMETIDSGKITILTALDMSAAFDTLDHTTLLHRLQHTFGLSGYVISWVRSYLTNRTSFVKIDSSSSPNTTICTGVPQGSVLGPLLFVLFISPVANVIILTCQIPVTLCPSISTLTTLSCILVQTSLCPGQMMAFFRKYVRILDTASKFMRFRVQDAIM